MKKKVNSRRRRTLRNNKKLFLIAGLISVSMLTGCGNATEKEDDTKAETSAAESTAESTEAAETEGAESEDTMADSSDAETADTATEDAKSEESNTVSVAGWNFTVEDVQKSKSLENVSVELGYTDVETNSFKKEASDGKTFCMIKMKIEKDGSTESIDWANMKVTDAAGNEYERMEDEFLSDLGMMRMPGNTLNFGTSEGWMIYEVNEDAEGLTLNYSFNEEEYHCNL